MHYKVGTRGSRLALAQTEYVINKLKEAYPQDSFETVIIKTTGDSDQNTPLDKIGSKGLFIDKIEEALLHDEIQLAVHSMKDMPDTSDERLSFSKAWKREDPRDVLILKDASSLDELRRGAVIATGSKRRACQLLKLRPDIKVKDIRGNVDTRIRRLKEGMPDGSPIDGIILAAAGLKRLARESEITAYFSLDEMIPAPAQGILAIEFRKSDTALAEKLDMLHDSLSESCAYLERGFLKEIGAGCHAPAGAIAEYYDDRYHLRVLYGDEECRNIAVAEVCGIRPDLSLVKQAADIIRQQLND